MTKDTFTLLAAYNKDANAEMNVIIRELDAAAWDKQLGGFFSSVHSLCSHIYISDYNWIKRFKSLRTFKIIDSFFDRDINFDELLFDSKEQYLEKRSVMDEKLISFVEEFTETDLQQTFHFSNSAGKQFEKKAGPVLLHAFSHETHHRAMISLYLELLGKANDFNSILKRI
jgi:uncharacterized damage-inducible protein DinB